jgi:hypothetical protein
MSTFHGDSTFAGVPRGPHPGGRATATQANNTGKRQPVRRPRRPLGLAVLHAPQVLRALVRADEIWLVVLAAFVGCGTGVIVWLMTETTQLIHEILFGIGHSQRLSAMEVLDPLRTVAVPALGGLFLGLLTLGISRIYQRRTVDPIEANALFGGRMSLTGSLIVVLQTVISNGVGASVGLEAGYTQIGSAIASRWGHAFRVRRGDLRLLVGCGAAGAIAGAFNAPLTGAFYAFELIIGTYTLGTFAPVAVSAIVSMAVVQALGGALYEAIDFADGRILNPRFSQYRVPRFADAPQIEAVLVDRKDLPSAGAGETPLIGLAPAVGNAIFAACGVRLRAMPLAPGGAIPAAGEA